MDKTFSAEVKQAVKMAQNDFCRKDDCLARVHSYHHKLKNTAENRRKYPLFIHSPFNCVGLCLNHHTMNDYEFKITLAEAEVYEKWLEGMRK